MGGDFWRRTALISSVDCHPGSALKIFVYMSRINKKKLMDFFSKAVYHFAMDCM